MMHGFEYGAKDIKVGDVFKIQKYLVHCTWASAQVLRFTLFFEMTELEVQKILMPCMRQPWRILKANFQFEGEEKGRMLNCLFYDLDDYLKPKNRYDRSDKD